MNEEVENFYTDRERQHTELREPSTCDDLFALQSRKLLL